MPRTLAGGTGRRSAAICTNASQHDGRRPHDDAVVDDRRGDRAQRRGDLKGVGGTEWCVHGGGGRIWVRTKGIEASARAASTAHTATGKVGRFAAGDDDGGGGGGDADGAAQLGDETATAAAHVEPELHGEQRRGDRERNEPRPAGRGNGEARRGDERDQLDQRDPPCHPCPRQRASPAAIDQRQLQRGAHEEGEERRRADRHTGPGEPDEQPKQHRFERQPPAAVLAGDGNGPPQRAIAAPTGGAAAARTAVTR